MSGRESKQVGGQSPRGTDRGSRGPVCREGTFQGQSPGEGATPQGAASGPLTTLPRRLLPRLPAPALAL